MATKKKAKRTDPKKNKSLAIRMALGQMPEAKATEIVDLVKKEYGHAISLNMVYMVKAKTNAAAHAETSGGNGKEATSTKGQIPITSAANWVNAIKHAKNLLVEVGGVDNAVALLKAVNA